MDDLPGGSYPGQFSAARHGETFFVSPTRDEALARVQFLVAQHHPCGLLVGEAGMGKSWLLSVLADACRRQGMDVARVNLTGVAANEFPLLLAAQLTSLSLGNLQPLQAWRAVEQRFAENHYAKRSTLITLDDADQGEPAVWEQVLRLVHSGGGRPTGLTVVCASQGGAGERIPVEFRRLATLRIELPPWQLAETRDFLAHRLAAEPGERRWLDPAAVTRIHAAAAGNPQRILQLAELAVLVATSQDAAHVDPVVVSQAEAEWSLAGLAGG
ncbi:MAG: hypothetical protein GTO03_18170 [Planctomycetales bacterium]|nr:hypothetical protein [Planctomycetales bacterium]